MKKWLVLLLIGQTAFAGFTATPRMPVIPATTNQWVNSLSANGTGTTAQPGFSNLSGSVAASQMPALSGDVSSSAGATATTLATVNSNTGSFGDATHIPQITVNGKGLITAVTTVAPSLPLAPVVTRTFTSGSGTFNKDYTFIITSGNATAAATYTNNGITYTVFSTVAGATQVVMSGSGAPTASGTLTKASGTGDATLTFSQVIAPLWMKVKAVGGGGGGAGSGTASCGAGGAGGATTFGTSLLSAGGGGGGGACSSQAGAGGGNSSVAAPALGLGLTGGSGGGNVISAYSGSPIFYLAGGNGGSSAFGGAGSGSDLAGGAGVANTGGGGAGGGGAPGGTNFFTGTGGGSGGFIEATLSAPGVTYSYAIGSGGTTGTAGTGGNTGGAGGSGMLYVEEHFQ